MYDIKIKEAFKIKNVFEKDDLRKLQKYAMKLWILNPHYSDSFGRHEYNDTPELKYFHNLLLPKARELFESDTLMPSWCFLAIYEGNQANLWKHKDDNACTYNIDVCVFQKNPWDIWVEGKPISLEENEAACMYGNDQEHWREEFPNPETNLVCNAFFFYCEPDHWYFTEGPQHLFDVIRANKNKEDV